MTEKEILAKLLNLDYDIDEAKKKFLQLKKDILLVEDNIISYKEEYRKLNNKLNDLRARTLDSELTDREKEILTFKEKLPELLKKI